MAPPIFAKKICLNCLRRFWICIALKFFGEKQSLIPNRIFGSKLLKGGKFVLREAFSDICEVSVGVFKALYHKIFNATLEEVIFLKISPAVKKCLHNFFFSYSGFYEFTFENFWKYIFLLLENLSSVLDRN